MAMLHYQDHTTPTNTQIEYIIHMDLIKPIDDLVLLNIKPKEKTGLIELVSESISNEALVLAVGEGRINESTGDRLPMTVSVGDKVMISPGRGVEIEYNMVKYTMIRECDILAILP